MRDPRIHRLARVALVTGFAVAATPLFGITAAYACNCPAATDAQHYADADSVFKGTVVRRVMPEADVRTSDETMTYVFDVTRTYKGRVGDPQRVQSAVREQSCGLALTGKGPFLVFATEPRARPGDKGVKGRALEASLCGGTRPLGAKEKPSFQAPQAAGPAAKPAGPAPAPGPVQPLPEAEPIPAGPAEPAERTALDTVNSLARQSQHFANRLVGPLLESPRG